MAAGTIYPRTDLMDRELCPNSQAILLLSAPLLIQNSSRSIDPMSPGKYRDLARRLDEMDLQPSDLFDSAAITEIEKSWPEAGSGRLRQLLDRGFLLAQAVEHWRARSIWVITVADEQYPNRLKDRMGERAPLVLYGCGELSGLDDGGLAVVGSRRIDGSLVQYSEAVGQSAAEVDVGIISGGARGVDQAAMRGSLNAGGRALGVLANGLEREALNYHNREPLMGGQLVLVCPYDPAVRFLAWHAMHRNKLIYALADAALVVNSDHGRGGTWAGATEQLGKFRFVPVYVRRNGVPSIGLDALASRGAQTWPEPESQAEWHEILAGDLTPLTEIPETVQLGIFPPEGEADVETSAGSERKETATAELADPPLRERLAKGVASAAERLLPAMDGEMTRKQILAAIGLTNWSYAKKRYVDPCLGGGWIENTNTEAPESKSNGFRLTRKGISLAESIETLSTASDRGANQEELIRTRRAD